MIQNFVTTDPSDYTDSEAMGIVKEEIRLTKNSKLSDPVEVIKPAVKLHDDYLARLFRGEVPQLLKLGSSLNGMEIGPYLISIVGAPPGFGKTAYAMQTLFEAIEFNPKLNAYIANAETSFDGLLRRELTRQTQINSDAIRFGKLTEDQFTKIKVAGELLRPRLDRVSVLEECNLFGLQKMIDYEPGLLIVDYLQKFSPGGDAKQGITSVMSSLRALAKAGWSVLCLSATSRTQSRGGSEHKSSNLNQASFRDSSEIEFNADSCYILNDKGPHDRNDVIRQVCLACVKNRHGRKVDSNLLFDMAHMAFSSAPPINELVSDFNNYRDIPNPFDDGADDE